MKFSLSSIAIAIVVFACVLLDLHFKLWKKADRVIEHDIHGYYSYLPATFIYDDVRMEKSDYRFGEDYYLFWFVYPEEGTPLVKFTMGLSVLYAPFFFVANYVAPLAGYPQNGFSEPYKLFLLLSALFYLFIGLDFLRKILQGYKFSDLHTAITILLLGLGTNLLCYSSQSAPMSHVYNFCLFAIFIYYTIKWHERQSFKNTLILGLAFGLIVLIRPSNVPIIIFFLLYNVLNWTEFKEKILLLLKKYYLVALLIILPVILWVPQFIYWKMVTGHYFFYSYTDEHFFFNRPHLIDGLFSFRKGWLLYTPMMAFSLIGIFFMKDELKKLRLPIFLFFVVNIYIIFSWWCWWYGGTYGQRSLIESYAILALPLASFVRYVSDSRWYYKICFYSVALFFIWLNIIQTIQFENTSLHWDGMTKELYFKQFGKLAKIPDFDKWVDSPNFEEAKKGKSNPFEFSPQKSDKLKRNKNEHKIHLLASNNKYVCADRTIKNLVKANRDTAYEWETFVLTKMDNGKFSIRASDNHYFCAELHQHNEITATRDYAGNWESFEMIDLGDNNAAFKAANGKYLRLDEKSLELVAGSDSIGKQEKFRITSN